VDYFVFQDDHSREAEQRLSFWADELGAIAVGTSYAGKCKAWDGCHQGEGL